MKKRLITFMFVLTLILSLGFLGACSNEEETDGPTNTEVTSPYKIKITAIGETTINVSQSIQLRSSVTGTTSKDVTWSSSDESLATVSENGKVTALGAGEVTITATLKIDSNCKSSIKITIEKSIAPTSMTIIGYDSTTQWVGQSLSLEVETLPEGSSNLVTFESSNEQVATINQEGLVNFIEAGEVTITAISKEDNTLVEEVTFKVKKGMFRSDLGSPYWNLENQADDNKPIITINEDTPSGYHSAYFAHVSSTKYYAEATFKITKQLSGWVWQGVGIGSGLSESDTRYYLFSPRVEGQGNDFNKTIIKDLPNESWPAITTRSQVWGENGLNNIAWNNTDVKITMIRNGNEYYYFINDRLMWHDNSTKYEDIPTMPILCAIDVACEVTNFNVTTDEEVINQKLDSPECKKSFYTSNPDYTSYTSDENFSFNVTTVLNKDNKVRSLGDKAKLVGNFEVEFDVSNTLFNAGHTSGFTGVTCNFSRYEAADTVESFMIGKSAHQASSDILAGYASWNYQLSMDDPNSMYHWLETSKAVHEDDGQTHHIKITRTIIDNVSYFKMWVDGVECDFDVKSNKNYSMKSKYTGAYLIWVGGEYTSADITNFKFKSM